MTLSQFYIIHVDMCYTVSGIQPYDSLLNANSTVISELIDVINPVQIPSSTSNTQYELIEQCKYNIMRHIYYVYIRLAIYQ